MFMTDESGFGQRAKLRSSQGSFEVEKINGGVELHGYTGMRPIVFWMSAMIVIIGTRLHEDDRTKKRLKTRGMHVEMPPHCFR
jgi:hypothetical protein